MRLVNDSPILNATTPLNASPVIRSVNPGRRNVRPGKSPLKNNTTTKKIPSRGIAFIDDTPMKICGNHDTAEKNMARMEAASVESMTTYNEKKNVYSALNRFSCWDTFSYGILVGIKRKAKYNS
ncbi:unnamed protein product [Rotaria socialis]|uniref:Uncharacterized protein n=1 Tax=Rotaria socialis TaxID=392032 RepID=A0A820XK53_9BILA|nr:unnamed protein product [Rotaria socialis]